MTDPMALTLVEAAAAISAGDVSPTELAAASLDAIEAGRDSVSAFVALDAERALADAAALADELTECGPRSPLHGIPVAVKDLMDVAGLPTRAGSAVLADAPPAGEDAMVVTLLRRAGAVIVGKTHTHEFALGAVTPQVQHPTHPDHVAGGSSGGSAAAVAAHQVFLALGTDTGGSIRVPSAFCGTVGLKPRHGRLPMDGIVPLAPLLDTCGPITRTLEDVRLAWSVLRGGPNRPANDGGTGTDDGPGADDVSGADGPLRVGVVDADALGTVDSEVAAAVGDAAERLAEQPDTDVRPVVAPPFAAWTPARGLPLLVDALAVHRARGWYPQHAQRYGAGMRAALERTATLGATDVTDALRTLRPLVEAIDELLLHYDVLLLPTTTVTAPTRAQIDAGPDPDGRYLLALCSPFNWCPVAAISVPCGIASNGLPIGLQLVGRDEDTVLRAAARVGRALLA